MRILYTLLLLPTICLAQTQRDAFAIAEEELNPPTEEVLIKKPEKYLRNESMIYDFNTDRGIKDQRRYTGADRNRLSIAGHVNGQYEHVSRLYGVELNYMRRSARYNQIWYGAQYFRHNTYFTNITQNHTALSGSGTSEGDYQRPNGTRNTVSGLGVGGSYRFKLLLDFIDTEDWFESVDVFANYVSLNENYIGKTYTGWGLSTNYGLHKRSSNSFFWGGKFSYNIASVAREQLTTESKANRSLSLGWLSFAFELGTFF